MNIRKLLITTAIATMTASGAWAAAPMAGDTPYLTVQDNAETLLGSEIIGATVYDSAAQNGNALGDVNDIVLSPEGGIDAVIIGVGGFLGIGEKDVAVRYDAFQWQRGEDGRQWLVLATNKEQLEAAPAFVRVTAEAPADMRQPAGTAMAPATPPAAATPGAPAATPADRTAAAPPAMAPANPAAPAGTPAQTFDISKVTADELLNTTVYSTGDENIGEIGDVIMSSDGKVDAVVIEVGGFLGIGEKPVAISFSDLKVSMDGNNNLVLHTTFTKEQLEAAPTYDESAFKSNRDAVIVRG